VNLTKRSLENILAVGDVVTLQNSAELMTVESVRTGALFLSVFGSIVTTRFATIGIRSIKCMYSRERLLI
jgi:hypothetical protein